jgi:hypothetical protein
LELKKPGTDSLQFLLLAKQEQRAKLTSIEAQIA